MSGRYNDIIIRNNLTVKRIIRIFRTFGEMYILGVIILDILNRIILLLGDKDQQDLTDYLKLKKVAFSDWKSGKSKSYLKYLIEISEFFNVSIDYLVYGKEKESSSPQLSDDQQRLLQMYSMLSDMEKGEILGELKAITKNRKPISENKKNPNIQTVFMAARSSDNHPPEIVTTDISDILNAPDSTDKY